MFTKTLIKKHLSSFFSSIWLFDFLESCLLGRKAFVLMYHRVIDPNDSQEAYFQPGMYVTKGSFEMQIAFLKNRYQLLHLEELITKIKKGSDISGCCALTFDDGWRDNFSNAFPILTKYQVPATIFLASSFIGTSSIFWPEEISSYLAGKLWTRNCLDGVCICAEKFQRQIEKFRSEGRDSFLNQAIEILKTYPPGERKAVLEFYRRKGRPCNLPRQMMTWDEARAMETSGLVNFGAHTATHEILDQLPVAEARREIVGSREEILRHLGVEVSSFAYPNGNYNEKVKTILREEGFEGAVTTRKGFFDGETPLLEIPRINIHEDISSTSPMFRARIVLENF